MPLGASGTFGGYQQHDSHEFMSYLLDGLHEDLNHLFRRIRVFSTGETQRGYYILVQLNCVHNKPLTAPAKLENCPNQEVTEESWRVYQLQNISYFLITHFQVYPHLGCGKV